MRQRPRAYKSWAYAYQLDPPAHRLTDGRRHLPTELAVRHVLARTRSRGAAVAKALVERDGLPVPASDSRLAPTKIRALPLSPTPVEELAALRRSLRPRAIALP